MDETLADRIRHRLTVPSKDASLNAEERIALAKEYFNRGPDEELPQSLVDTVFRARAGEPRAVRLLCSTIVRDIIGEASFRRVWPHWKCRSQ